MTCTRFCLNFRNRSATQQKLCLRTELEDLRSSDPFYILCPKPHLISKYATTVLSIPGRVFLRPVTIGDLDAPLARNYTIFWNRLLKNLCNELLGHS